MRIASLLPSASEIVCAVGAGGDLVGISHECDWPRGVERGADGAALPVLTRPRRALPKTSPGIDAAVREVAAELEARSAALAVRASAASTRPRVLTIEWLAPVMVGGTWMPELVSLAGGEPLVTQPGQHAPTLTLDELRALEPDVVLIKPCGFPLDHTLRELELLREQLPWGDWRAVAEGAVYLADGNAYFNRPGPRLVESAEILAACIHPELFADLRAKHAASMRRLLPDLRLEVPS